MIAAAFAVLDARSSIFASVQISVARQLSFAARTMFVADAHRDGGQRFVVRADERLTAFVELERVTSDDSD
jgi:hypothetical protein